MTKRWSHHSTHSGYDRVIDYMGEAIERIDLSRLSSRWIPERLAMKFVSRADIRGYSMASFYDEWGAARDMIARPDGPCITCSTVTTRIATWEWRGA